MFEAPMWDDRYSADEYLFGTEPAAFLTRHTDLLRGAQLRWSSVTAKAVIQCSSPNRACW